MNHQRTSAHHCFPGIGSRDALDRDARRAWDLIEQGRFAAALAVLTVTRADRDASPVLYLLLATAREGLGNWQGTARALLHYLECGLRGAAHVDRPLATRWLARLEPVLAARAA